MNGEPEEVIRWSFDNLREGLFQFLESGDQNSPMARWDYAVLIACLVARDIVDEGVMYSDARCSHCATYIDLVRSSDVAVVPQVFLHL